MPPDAGFSLHDLLDVLVGGAGVVGGIVLKAVYDRRKAKSSERHTEHGDDQQEIQSLWLENRKLRDELSLLRERLAILESKQVAYEINQRIAIATIKGQCANWRAQPCPRLVELGDVEAIAILKAKKHVGKEKP